MIDATWRLENVGSRADVPARLSLIVNPSAGDGRARRALPEVEAALAQRQLEYHVETTTSLAHAGELARDALAAGETAVAFGGDGLIGAVADALKYTDGILGVLPGGRGNDFARMLGIPLRPEAACEVLCSGVVRSLDLGQVGSKTFTGIASCGFDSDANRIANETRIVGGTLVYAYGALRAIAGWRPATFRVAIDGGEAWTVTGYSVAAANSRVFGGGMFLAPEASLQDGLLDVVTISDMPKLRYLRLLPTVFRGQHVRRRDVVEVRRTTQLEISADRPFTMYADGDPIGELPVKVRALAGAVRALVPAR
jgi:YegS/Rv2252/BmrU family lipid kinase